MKLQPWRQYHAAVWLKTWRFDAANDIRILVLGQDGRQLSYSNLRVKRNQTWTRHHIVFNSLGNEKIRFYIGVWGGRGGKLWIDDAVLEETAFVNLLRRPGCPLIVRSEDGIVYNEGQDFQTLVDSKVGQVPYAGCYDVYHVPPELKLTPGSRIKEGQRILVDFYHTVTIYDGQVTCCLGADKVFEIIEEQVRRVHEAMRPRTYLLSYDEIRVANWCKACNSPGRSAGQLLAENVRKVAAIVRKTDPDARLCIWSDMFDPHHNARDRYYLVNGDLRGSWNGLDRDMIVVNWNRGKAAKSLAHFNSLGHEQVLAGYYDGDPKDIRNWLQVARNMPAVCGVMYTTWRDDFSKIEQFARYAWGIAQQRK
ncbi:MAG TPA: hypothetical protein EYP14_10265 [Planctomycetaceae bacterium]|nr:hypothetical protein [Planctomycetaceae bacterium]